MLRLGTTRLVTTPAAVLAATLALPDAATAHSLGSAAGKSTPEFVLLGMEHMLLGWDHLLFVLGCILLAGTAVRAAKLITAFVAGHSLTLVIATLAGWAVSATAVDVVIALSVLFVGVLGLRGRPQRWAPVTAAIFGFGLVHGMGLSTRLQFLGLPEEGEVARIVAFNVGLELGQLVAIGVIVGAGVLARRAVRRDWAPVRRGAFGAIAVAGAFAALLLSLTGAEERSEQQRASGSQADDTEEVGRSCERTEDLLPPPGLGGGHPAKSFYEPGETAPEEDLQHVIGDGYVIVRYRDDVPAAQLDQLRAWVADHEDVIAAPTSGPVDALRATTAYRELTCSTAEIAALEAFSDEWRSDVRAGTAQS